MLERKYHTSSWKAQVPRAFLLQTHSFLFLIILFVSSYSFFFRLWQNGITSTGGNIDLNISIPFTPYGLEAYKGTLILQQYLPNSAQTFYYGDLQQADLVS